MVISWTPSGGLTIVNILDSHIRSPFVLLLLCREMGSLVFPEMSRFKIIHVSESEPLAVGTHYGKVIQV